jgi:hypothetical protein
MGKRTASLQRKEGKITENELFGIRKKIGSCHKNIGFSSELPGRFQFFGRTATRHQKKQTSIPAYLY